jgi:hypothetical protein
MLMKILNKLDFAIHRWRYAEGRYYKHTSFSISEGDDIEYMAFKILKGPFKGTVYCYTKLTYTDNGVDFGWFIVKGKGKENPKFPKIARNILLVILHHLMEGKGFQMGLKPGEEYESDRESHSEESYNERTIRKEGSSLFEE